MDLANLGNMDFSMLLQQAGIKRYEVPALPRGWIREEVPKFYSNGGLQGRGGGLSMSGVDVVYYSPTGVRVKNKPEMAKALGDAYDVTAFDFQSGQINPLLLRTSAKPGPSGNSSSNSGSRKTSKPVSTSSNRTSAQPQTQNGRSGGGGSSSVNNKNSASGGNSGNANSSATSAQNAVTAAAAAAAVVEKFQPDNTLVPPIRQTASIFKQPVTAIKLTAPPETDPTVKAKPALKELTSDRPNQLFWEKRLSGLSSSYPNDIPMEDYDDDEEEEIELIDERPISNGETSNEENSKKSKTTRNPKPSRKCRFKLSSHFKPVGPPGIETDPVQVLASISSSLHLANGSAKAINGQANAKAMRESDPSAFLTPDQPLIQSTRVSQSDVEKQEARVVETRKRLAEAIQALTA